MYYKSMALVEAWRMRSKIVVYNVNCEACVKVLTRRYLRLVPSETGSEAGMCNVTVAI